MFLICLIFFFSFYSNSSVSSIDTIFCLRNSYFISLLIFTCLPFNPLSSNSIKYFSNSKRMFFIFSICLSTFSQIILVLIGWIFYPYIFKTMSETFLKTRNVIFKKNSSDFWVISSNFIIWIFHPYMQPNLGIRIKVWKIIIR